MIFSMRELPPIIVLCLLVLSSRCSFAQEYSSSSYERYVPLTDRAFEVKVQNLRSQVNSYEERLRASRLRWNQLFNTQFELEKGEPAQKLNDKLGASVDPPPTHESKSGSSEEMDASSASLTNAIKTKLQNRYYLGFSLGALVAQPTKLSYQSDEIPIEFDTSFAGGLEMGRRFEQWSFSFSYVYSQANLSEEAWSDWLWASSGFSIPVGKTGILSLHNMRFEGNYLLDVNPWLTLDLGLGAGYSFSSLSDMPLPYPDQSVNSLNYSASIGSRITISDRGTLNLSLTYLGSFHGQDSLDSINAYLAEIGAHFYF